MEPSDPRHEIACPETHGIARVVVKRNPNLCFRGWKTKLGWHHADYLAVDATQFDRSANDSLIACEALLPNGVAQNREAILARNILAGMKRPAHLGLGAKNGQQLRGYRSSRQSNGLARASQVE